MSENTATAGEARAPRVVLVGLASCFGCQINIKRAASSTRTNSKASTGQQFTVKSTSITDDTGAGARRTPQAAGYKLELVRVRP